MSRLFLLLSATLFLTHCARKPAGVFEASAVPVAPDYSQSKYWAALPDQSDQADVLLDEVLKDRQAEAAVDVFWIHPTTYTGKRGERNWNAPADDADLNERTDESTIKYQASAFNGVGKIYAPRYRQIQLQVFDAFEGAKRNSALQATQVAYSDVKLAFEYYLEHYNNGRPIVIASHSQGTMLAKELLKDYFDGKALQQQLVAAYLVGIPVPKKLFQHISVCENPNQTGCFTTWRTFKKGYVPQTIPTSDSIAVTNPLTWTTDDTYAPASLNEGTLIDDKNGYYKGIADAQVNTAAGILWLTKPKSPLRLRFFPSKNFHIGDINLYYANVRANAQERVKAFLAE
ncbi:MAG: DUF3089 domain-containing protein [Bacteroidota bacterium]